MTRWDEPKMDEGDEFELRVGPLRGVGEMPSHATPVSRRRSRLVVVLTLSALVAVVAGAFALARGGSDPGGTRTATFGSRPLAVATPTPRPTPIPYPTPTLGQGTPTALGPAPATCAPPAPAPQTLSYGVEGAIGGPPVWVTWFDGPQATRHLGARGLGYSRYGWLGTIFLAVEPGFTDPVVVRGERLDDGSPVWIGVLGSGQTFYQATPLVAVVLDPRQSGVPDYRRISMGLGEDWAAWDATIYIPAAGCYAIEASWPGGSWRLTFAVGQ
jgi:hypothetical protein